MSDDVNILIIDDAWPYPSQYTRQQSWIFSASSGVYPSVRRVSTPWVGTCVCEPSQVRCSLWNAGHVLAIVHGFRRGVPLVRAAWLTRPYIHPSRA